MSKQTIAALYRVGRLVVGLRDRLLEMEVILRDLTLSGEASNEDLAGDLAALSDRVHNLSLSLGRACHRLAGRSRATEPQLIERREFQPKEICRFFGIPRELLGDMPPVSSWGAGVTQRFMARLAVTLDAWRGSA